MSNRSKKDIFVKESNDTLKKIIISPELRNKIMELITGTKPKNGQESLKWSLEHEKYLKAENAITDDVARYITTKRQELYSEATSWNNNVKSDGSECKTTNTIRGCEIKSKNVDTRMHSLGHSVSKYNSDTLCASEEWRTKANERDRVIIHAEVFDDYLTEKEAICKELKKYTDISKLNSDSDALSKPAYLESASIKTRKIVEEYVYCVLLVIQHKYGSPLGVKNFSIDNYKTILKLYEQHKNEYNLTYPGFPEELLVNQIRIPDESIRPHKKT